MAVQKQRDLTESERRKRTKEVYERAIRATDFNSGHMQPPLASKPSVIGTLQRAGYGLEEIHRALTAARRNGDLFEAEDREGRKRIGIDDAEVLLEKIETNRSRAENPRRDVIGIANQRIQYLRGETDD
ncbi:hypothetical protein [Halopiger thermotolerans]